MMQELDLVAEIREAFAYLPPGSFGRVSALPPEHPGSVYVGSGTWGVSIPLATENSVSERFAGARLYTAQTSGTWDLRLECDSANRRNEFAVVCAQFLEPGDAGEERNRISGDPIGWWKRWRELLGNAIRLKQPFSVLGELLALEMLVKAGEEPVWLGPVANSHDIEARAASYEVKSTLSKYSSVFHVAGQFQLRETAGKTLHIIHQRFEPSSTGESINSAALRLMGAGADRETIEKALTKLGYEAGSSDRDVKYQWLQSMKYLVDNVFPRITPSSFVGGALPTGIVAVEYDVDLAGMAGTSLL